MKTVLELVTEKHNNQFKEYTNEPYINYLIRVASNFKETSCEYYMSLCSDLFTKTNCTLEELYLVLMNTIASNRVTSSDLFSSVILKSSLQRSTEAEIQEDWSDYVNLFIRQLEWFENIYLNEEWDYLSEEEKIEYEIKRTTYCWPYPMTVKYAIFIEDCSLIKYYDYSKKVIEYNKIYKILQKCKQGDFDLYYKAITKHSECGKLLNLT